MATSALQPPPQVGGEQPAPATPTSPPAASPAPARPSPQMQQGTQDMIEVVNKLRGIAKNYPKAAPFVTQMNDLARQVMAVMMEGAEAAEPAAPPVG